MAYPKYIEVRYTKMVTNFLKEYIVINEIVKQKIKNKDTVQTKMRKNKIFTIKRMLK